MIHRYVSKKTKMDGINTILVIPNIYKMFLPRLNYEVKFGQSFHAELSALEREKWLFKSLL